MSSEVIVVLPAFQLAMSILPGVNITSLQFSSPKGLPGVLRSYSPKVVKPLRQRFDYLSKTLLNAPYTNSGAITSDAHFSLSSVALASHHLHN